MIGTTIFVNLPKEKFIKYLKLMELDLLIADSSVF
jgi:hypothetical protein